MRGVTIQLDVPRLLRFDGIALLRLEEITGMNVLQICRQFSNQNKDDEKKTEKQRNEERAANFSLKLVVQIAQAGLHTELPFSSTEDIIQLMDNNGKGDGPMQRVLSYTENVFKALSEAIGSDSKNVKTDLEKKTQESLGRKKKPSVGPGTPINA